MVKWLVVFVDFLVEFFIDRYLSMKVIIMIRFCVRILKILVLRLMFVIDLPLKCNKRSFMKIYRLFMD
jgi:hypothetical protein